MKINEGDLVTVHYDHVFDGQQTEAGIVVNNKSRQDGKTELWLHPGELANGPASLVEIGFGPDCDSFVRRAHRKERATLFLSDGSFSRGRFNRKRATHRVSAVDANLVVKDVSRTPTIIYADAVAHDDRTTYVH